MTPKTLTQRIATLERKLARKQRASFACPPASLSVILKTFPGGLTALAEASGTHIDTIGKFATARRSHSFPAKVATRIAMAIRKNRRRLGNSLLNDECDVEWLRQMWEQERADRLRSGDAQIRSQKGA